MTNQLIKCHYFGRKCQSKKFVEYNSNLSLKMQLHNLGWDVSSKIIDDWVCPDCKKALAQIKAGK